jgi:hypothetical protein
MKKSLVFSVVFLATGFALCAENKSVTDADKKVAGELAAEYNLKDGDMINLRDRGLGWGEIGRALAVVKKAGVPLTDVIGLRDSKMGWGEIAKKYNMTVGDLDGNGNAIEARAAKAAATPPPPAAVPAAAPTPKVEKTTAPAPAKKKAAGTPKTGGAAKPATPAPGGTPKK